MDDDANLAEPAPEAPPPAGAPPPPVSCAECGALFASRNQLFKHLKTSSTCTTAEWRAEQAAWEERQAEWQAAREEKAALEAEELAAREASGRAKQIELEALTRQIEISEREIDELKSTSEGREVGFELEHAKARHCPRIHTQTLLALPHFGPAPSQRRVAPRYTASWSGTRPTRTGTTWSHPRARVGSAA